MKFDKIKWELEDLIKTQHEADLLDDLAHLYSKLEDEIEELESRIEQLKDIIGYNR